MGAYKVIHVTEHAVKVDADRVVNPIMTNLVTLTRAFQKTQRKVERKVMQLQKKVHETLRVRRARARLAAFHTMDPDMLL